MLEQLYSIVNQRYEDEKALVITTNLDPDELAEQIGERTVSRAHRDLRRPDPARRATTGAASTARRRLGRQSRSSKRVMPSSGIGSHGAA